jgi:integrase/recombinase XerD
MLETYFVKPQTVDRIRACWIGAEIESYADWLSEQGYSARTVLRRIPVLVAFGEFARRRGASAPADLPAHVDGFAAMRVASFRRGQDAAGEIRGVVEQMLAVVLPGFECTGRPRRELPFAGAVPGFFGYLAAERGLRPESIVGYRHHLACFEAYLGRIGVTGLAELSPPV